MNKVVSIELASQVFWIDESAFDVLQSYLQKIKQQLAEDECGTDIYNDIELRIAELLYELRSDAKKAISTEQLNNVIKQVGFLDSEEQNEPETIPKKSYRDPKNKIVGGVCSGLAIRLGVPAFILRLAFLTLTAAFGLGIALYLIFWISLDTNTDRNSALASQGKAQTAKQIAQYEAPKVSKLIQLQRVIFLPFSIFGTLLSVVANHFKNRRRGYIFLFKNVIALGLIVLSMIVLALLVEFNGNRLFNQPVTWVLNAAVMYLVVLVLLVYVREFYLGKSTNQLNKSYKVDKKLKLAALLPLCLISTAIWHAEYHRSTYESNLVKKQFTLPNGELVLAFIEQGKLEGFGKKVRYQVRTSESNSNDIKVNIDYSGYGREIDDAKESIHAIDYFYTFDNGKLELDEYWTLKNDYLNKRQSVSVIIEVPQGIKLNSTRELVIDRDNYESNLYPYTAKRDRRYHAVQNSYSYITNNLYFHELNESVVNKLSENEREILNDKFCNEFFISEYWSCKRNISYSVTDNSRFDRAFQEDSQQIDQIREYLLPNRSFFVSNLNKINELVKGLSVEYPAKGEFQQYIEHLLSVKSTTDIIVNADSS